MFEQLSLFAPRASARNGEYVKNKGRALSWDELTPGMVVIYDCSTQSHEWLMVTTVERIVETPFDGLRVILNGGRKHRPLINRSYIENGSTKLFREAAG